MQTKITPVNIWSQRRCSRRCDVHIIKNYLRFSFKREIHIFNNVHLYLFARSRTSFNKKCAWGQIAPQPIIFLLILKLEQFQSRTCTRVRQMSILSNLEAISRRSEKHMGWKSRKLSSKEQVQSSSKFDGKKMYYFNVNKDEGYRESNLYTCVQFAL